MAPAESQSSIASESDPSDFEEEQEDGKRHAPESAWALTSAISGKTLFSWLDAPRGEPSPQAQRFEIALGMPRGPPARG